MADNATARETLFALREQIAKLEGKPVGGRLAEEQEKASICPKTLKNRKSRPRLSLGIDSLDVALEGGLPLDGFTEIRSRSMFDAGAASGFVLALAAHLKARETSGAPVLWIGEVVSMHEAGAPYAVGLAKFGLSTRDMLYALPRRLEDALWLAEAAVASGALAAIILEVRSNPKHLGLTESRRLSLRAKTAERPFLLLRHAGEEEASSALFRFLVEPAPATKRRLPDGSLLGGSIGHPVFRLTLEKSRIPAPLSLSLEWNNHDRRFVLCRETGEAPSLQNPTHSGTGFPASVDRQDRTGAMGNLMAFERAS